MAAKRRALRWNWFNPASWEAHDWDQVWIQVRREREGVAWESVTCNATGLDSTAMLYRLLTQTDQDLRVHHLRMVNREGRAQAEQEATEAVVAWCRANCRPFRYSESGIDFADLDTVPIDYLTVAFVACQVVIDTPGCNRIAVGTLHADLDEVKRKVSVAQRTVF